MRLSAKGEYSLLAMSDLSENYNEEFIKIEDISRRKKIPRKFLEQILLILNKAGYLKSKRGSNGGYKLTKKPSQIRVADIIRLIDGPLAPVGSVSEFFFTETPVQQSKGLLLLLKEVRDLVADKLEKTTFGDLI